MNNRGNHAKNLLPLPSDLRTKVHGVRALRHANAVSEPVRGQDGREVFVPEVRGVQPKTPSAPR